MRSADLPPSQRDTFRLARFRLRLKAKDALLLPPYKGSALRGGFGQVFRRIACLSEVLDHRQAGELTDLEQAELATLMRTYEMGLLRQSQAFAEAVRRGLLPPLQP